VTAPRLAVVTVAVAAAVTCAHAAAAVADDGMQWYRGFYSRVGWRDSRGAGQRFHTWAAPSFGVGYRHERCGWGVDGSVLNVQYHLGDGLQTIARILPYVVLPRALRVDAWLGAGLSFGVLQGTVDKPLPEREGLGLQVDAVLGVELPRSLRVRMFVQGAVTLPVYFLYDSLESTDSRTYAYAFEAAVGVRF
jgi:hypothetical protein